MRLRLLPALLLALAPLAAGAADDFKVLQLEQDVRDLARQVQAQSRQIDDLRRQLAQPRADRGAGTVAGVAPSPARSAAPSVTPPPGAGVSAGTAGSNLWVDAARWARLRPGMSELEVIETLGPPTSMRTREDTRVLLYALEIGSSGFLGGSVTLRDRVVTELRAPFLQ